jgi:predicted metal-dependent peptidase
MAKQSAEQVQKMCGTIPGQFKDYIDGLFKAREAVFNWKNYFRRVVGNSIKSFIKSTRYRPSFRFKGQPGNVLKFKPKVLVAVDTSGSVSNEELQEFFGEIQHLYKSGVSVDVVEFDTQIQNKFEYKGAKTEIPISGRGGTDCHSTVDYYIQHREYSTLVIFTDGYLTVNDLPLCQNLIWIITSDGYRQNYPGISIYIPKQNKK